MFTIFYQRVGLILTIFKPLKHKTSKIIVRCFWFAINLGGIYGAVFLTLTQYQRFQARPISISLDRDYRGWNGTIPALTLCYHDNLDTSKADELIHETWNTTVLDEDYDYYLEFLNSLLNATAANYLNLVRYAEDDKFEDIDLYDILKKVIKIYQQSIKAFDETFHIQVAPIMTEKGFCYGINTPMTIVLNRGKIENLVEPIICQFGKQECYVKMDIFESTGVIDVHSPFDIASAEQLSATSVELTKSDEVIASYKVMETISTEKVKDLNQEQRRCAYPYEQNNGLQYYTKSICLAKCRALMALDMCNCIPYFYQFVDGPPCTLSGFECLSDFKWPIWAQHLCNCPSSCTEQVYTIHSLKRNSWGTSENSKIMSSFRWDIVPPKVRMQRDVIFGFEELLVSFGGVFSLFLGSSFTTLSHVASILFEQTLIILINIFLKIQQIWKNCISRIRKNRLQHQQKMKK